MSAPRRVLVLGWLFLGALEVLHRHGCSIVLAVEPAKAAGARTSGIVECVLPVADPADTAGVLAALARAGLTVHDFDAVLTTGEYELVSATVLGELAGTATRDLGTALALRDKHVQKQRVRSAGVPVADCAVLDPADPLAGLPEPPVVVKPVSGVGSRDTVRIGTRAELRAFAERAGNRGPWLVESFVPGREYSLDGVVRDGEVLALALLRYLANLITIHQGGLAGGVALRPERFPGLYAEAHELARRSLRAIGHDNGVFHLEAFHDGERFTFGECAGRIGGGKIAGTLHRQFGLDLEDEWARAALRLPSAAVPLTAGSHPHGFVQLRTPPGVLEHVPSAQDVSRLDGVVHAEVHAHPGCPAPDTTTASDVQAGRVIATVPTAVDGATAVDGDEDAVAATLATVATWFHAHTTTRPA